MGKHSKRDPELDRRAFLRRSGVAVATGTFLAAAIVTEQSAKVPEPPAPQQAEAAQAAMVTATPLGQAGDAAVTAANAPTSTTPAPAPTTAPGRHAAPEPPVDGTLRERIIASARSYFGIPYRWGGTSRAGLDCSGLVYLVFRDVGIYNGPRPTAATLANWVTRIPASQAQPGDLVFEGSPATHVGIVSRPGVMINAPDFGTVVREDKIRAGMYFGRAQP